MAFQGASQINLDVKSRLAVPVKHREPLAASSGGRLVLTAHPDGALLLYPLAAWEPVMERVKAFPSLDRTAALWKRLLIGFADEVTLDGAGRILISPELRAYAGIDKQVMMAGQVTHFELWNLNAWNAQLKALHDRPAGVPPGTENFSL